MSDVPYVAYHNVDIQNLDVEIGFPVSKPLPGIGSIQSDLIPAGEVSFCIYSGAYSEMEAVYGEMSKWIEDNNYLCSIAYKVVLI